MISPTPDHKDLPDVNTDDDIKKKPVSTTISFAGVTLSKISIATQTAMLSFLLQVINTEGVFHTCPCTH